MRRSHTCKNNRLIRLRFVQKRHSRRTRCQPFPIHLPAGLHQVRTSTSVGQWGRIVGFKGPGCSSARGCSYSLDRADWKATYVVAAEEKTTREADVPPIPSNGIATNGGIGFRVRSNASVGWERGDFGLSWNLRHFSALKERCLDAGDYPDECSHPGQRAPWFSGTRDYNRRGSVTFHDVQARYNLPWDATVSIGANNVFGRQGPVMYSQPSSNFACYGGFDIGRFIYMKYQQRF